MTDASRVVIAGIPRCGTTLLASLLNAQPGCTFLTGYVSAFQQAVDQLGIGYSTPLTPAQRRMALLLAREQFLPLGHPLLLGADDFATVDELQARSLAEIGAEGDVVRGFKALLSPAQVRALARSTDVLCVIAYRDPRDSALSYWYRTGATVELYLQSWRSLVSLVGSDRSGRIIGVRYEELVRDPRAALAELSSITGLQIPVVPERLRLSDERGRAATDWAGNSAHGDVGGALSSAAVGRWKGALDSPVVQYAGWLCAPEIRQLGYPPDPAPSLTLPVRARFGVRRGASAAERAITGAGRRLTAMLRKAAPPITHR